MESADGNNQGLEAGLEPKARENEHVPPTFRGEWFHCLHCGVLSVQHWTVLSISGSTPMQHIYTPVYRCRCICCHGESYWLKSDESESNGEVGEIIFPSASLGPRPHVDMPADVIADFNEARSIVAKSPRGAGALARLAVQKLVDELEPGDGSLNDKIGRMAKAGLSPTVQEALDVLRVVGNNAVHPLELDLKDDVETVVAVFECMNLIVESQISQPKRVRSLFDRLPLGARKAIERRDREDK